MQKLKYFLIPLLVLVIALLPVTLTGCGSNKSRIIPEPPEPEPPVPVLTVPTAPTNFTAIAGDTQVTLQWGAPTNNGGAVITKYQVICYGYEVEGDTWINVTSTTTYTFTGLLNENTYGFRVRAVNSVGEGAYAEADARPTNQITGQYGAYSLSVFGTDFMLTDFIYTDSVIYDNFYEITEFTQSGTAKVQAIRGTGALDAGDGTNFTDVECLSIMKEWYNIGDFFHSALSIMQDPSNSGIFYIGSVEFTFSENIFTSNDNQVTYTLNGTVLANTETIQVFGTSTSVTKKFIKS